LFDPKTHKPRFFKSRSASFVSVGPALRVELSPARDVIRTRIHLNDLSPSPQRPCCGSMDAQREGLVDGGEIEPTVAIRLHPR
jgi:hypothetical protein